jgi:hypothetical protein
LPPVSSIHGLRLDEICDQHARLSASNCPFFCARSAAICDTASSLARDEVDRVFGEGYAAAHPQMVLAVMNTAATDWAARLLGGALEDIAAAVVEGGVELPGNAGLAVHPSCSVSIL